MPVPPGSATLEQQLQLFQKRLDDLSRQNVVLPACRVRMTGDAPLTATVDLNAQAPWAASEDTRFMFTPGAAGVNCYITIPVTGFYLLHYHCVVGGASVAAACKVFVNGGAVATAAVNPPGSGGDGTPMDALRTRIRLVAGDQITWSNWSSATATLWASVFSIPTEITVQYIAAQ